MKKCFKCGNTKPITEFYRHSEMSDGHLNKCKLCARLDVRKNRRENIKHYEEYERSRIREWGTRAQYRKRNPEKYKAQTAVGNAIRDGKLIKGLCEICGASNVQAHHDDYNEPLDVIWLCAKHHVWIHG
jgi:ribosomal protein S27AE